MTDEKILDKIRKLMAKAESTNHEAEASAFYEKAQSLMVQYAIDSALIAAGQGGDVRSKPIAKDVVYSTSDANVPPKRQLLYFCALANRCRVVFYTGSRHAQRASVVGFPEDVEFVEMLYTSLLMQGTRYGLIARPADQPKKRYMTQFLLGYVARVGVRLEEANQRARAQAGATGESSTALVLRSREQEVVDAMSKEHPNARTRQVRLNAQNAQAIAAGEAAGSRADISGGRNGVGATRQGALR